MKLYETHQRVQLARAQLNYIQALFPAGANVPANIDNILAVPNGMLNYSTIHLWDFKFY
jgi:hypothetical protein